MKLFFAAVSALLMLAGQASAKTVVEKTAKATVLPNSAESVAERSARLKRECKGGVNAGACAGYTR